MKVDLSLSRMKPLGAKWIMKLYDYLPTKTNIIKNGFKEAGINLLHLGVGIKLLCVYLNNV